MGLPASLVKRDVAKERDEDIKRECVAVEREYFAVLEKIRKNCLKIVKNAYL